MKHDLTYQHSPEYRLLSKTFADKVHIIERVIEGCHILQLRGEEVWTQRALCLCPIFEDDELLVDVGLDYIKNTGADYSVICAMEYRGIILCSYIKISPMTDVNELLIAEKVLARRDIEIRTYDYETLVPFHEWLDDLKVSEMEYKSYVKELKNIDSN